jgi:cytochrome c2
LWDDKGTITELRIAEPSDVETNDWMPPDFDKAQRQLASKLVLDCLRCHSVQPGSPTSTSPNLWNIYERPIGKSADFAGYSTALANRTGTWNEETLDEFLKDAEDFAPGNDMEYAPISDKDMRRAVVSYLRSLTPEKDQGAMIASWKSKLMRFFNIIKTKVGYY